jgi:DUF4097 and DUF4098 domain-containing protein YvlB
MINKTNIAITAVVAALLLISASQVRAETTKKSFVVKPGGTLYMRTDSGSVEVESHASERVDIEVEITGTNAKDFELSFSQDGNDVRITGERKRRFGSWHVNAKFVVKVPKAYNVDLKTGGGAIDISDLNGEVQAKTSGGSIDLGNIVGNVEVETSGGAISVDEVAGNIDAETSGGSIKARISKQPSEDSRLHTSGGSVIVYLASKIAVDLEARTSGGRVKSDFDVDGSVKRNRIVGKINGGGPRLDLSTSGGSVRIKSS